MKATILFFAMLISGLSFANISVKNFEEKSSYTINKDLMYGNQSLKITL